MKKNMIYYKDMHEGNVKAKKQQKEAKYTIYGFHSALIYWAFEAIPMLANMCARNIGTKFPRMLSWSTTNLPTSQQLSQLFKRKNVSLLKYVVILLFLFIHNYMFFNIFCLYFFFSIYI